MGAGVQVIDSRRQPELKVRVSRAGGASESVLVEPRPPVTEALQKWVAESYTGPQPFFVGLERLEVLHIAGASTVELSCSIDSQVRVGGESGHRVRTTFRGQDSASTAITAAIQTVLSQCIQSHAKDINATAIMR